MFTINTDFWAGVQAFVIAITAWLIYQQVKIQTKQAEIQTTSHIIETLGIIHSRWNSESMIRSRMNICNAYLI